MSQTKTTTARHHLYAFRRPKTFLSRRKQGKIGGKIHAGHEGIVGFYCAKRVNNLKI